MEEAKPTPPKIEEKTFVRVDGVLNIYISDKWHEVDSIDFKDTIQIGEGETMLSAMERQKNKWSVKIRE